jgi:hypothetical protein
VTIRASWPSQYLVGKRWVSLEAAMIKHWDEIAGMVLESYRMSAPKKSLTKLDALPYGMSSDEVQLCGLDGSHWACS